MLFSFVPGRISPTVHEIHRAISLNMSAYSCSDPAKLIIIEYVHRIKKSNSIKNYIIETLRAQFQLRMVMRLK